MRVPETACAAATTVCEEENGHRGWRDLGDVIGVARGVVMASGNQDRVEDGVCVEDSRKKMMLRGRWW